MQRLIFETALTYCKTTARNAKHDLANLTNEKEVQIPLELEMHAWFLLPPAPLPSLRFTL